MKKVLLLTALLIVSIVQAQRTVAECFEKAKPYFATNECNNTGLAWMEGVLKLDPSNVEAKKIIKNCDDIKFNDAKAVLKSDISDGKGKDVLSAMIISHPEYDTEEVNYLLAKANLEDGVSHIVKKYIEKAISYNPNNIDYRWIRVRCNMIMDGGRDSFKQASKDLNFMIENGANSAKVYSTLGLAEYQLGSLILRFSPVKSNDSYTDDTSSEKSQRKEIIEQTIQHYNKSKTNYQKGMEIGKEDFKDNLYEIKKIDKEIPELQEQLKKVS